MYWLITFTEFIIVATVVSWVPYKLMNMHMNYMEMKQLAEIGRDSLRKPVEHNAEEK